MLLPLQSYALPPEQLETLSRTLVEGFRAEGEIELVDATPLLSEHASADWLKADKLLYDGIQDYQNLEFVRAVEQLRESAELMERTFREFADVQGRRRMRDAYLHLGLARLEQGEQMEAEDWFAKAARVDPAFVPDPRAYPPVVRQKFAEAKGERQNESFDAGRERLRALGVLVGVDRVVAGGVRQDASRRGVAGNGDRRPDDEWFVEITWVNRWNGRAAVETASAPRADELPRVLREQSPKLLAGLLDRPWPPVAAIKKGRRRVLVGAASAVIPNARITQEAVGGQVYRWRDDIRQTGVHASLSPWERGAWSLETDVSLFLPQAMPGSGWESPSNAQGEFRGAGSLGAHALRTVRSGGWGVSGGLGLSLNEMIAQFHSSLTETGEVFVWVTPVVSLAAHRRVLAAGGVETFLQLEVAAHYDPLGSGPGDWMFQSVAAGGVAF